MRLRREKKKKEKKIELLRVQNAVELFYMCCSDSGYFLPFTQYLNALSTEILFCK